MKKTLLAIVLTLFATLAMAQQPVNDVGLNGVVISTGNGTQGTGTQRVVIASDQTIFPLEIGDGTHTVTLMSTTTTSKWGVDTNILSILGTAPTTAGFLDVKGADGNVFVRQTTGSNLHVQVDAGSATIGKVDLLGNAGAIMDFVGQAATSPANSLQVGAQFNTSPTTLTTGQSSPLQLDSSGKLLVNCTGCSAGSTVQAITGTSGGATASHRVTAGSDNATSIKGSAGQVYGVDVYNNAAYPVYAKLYNASASPTGCGATNLARVVGVQAGTHANLSETNGIVFGTGIGLCVTKGIADSDDTAVLASDAVVDISYK